MFDFFKRDKEEKDRATGNDTREENDTQDVHVCALCGQEIAPGEGKFYGGQWWHKKCLRKARKMARTMI